MSFLQPFALFALPALLVPIVIHLVHLRRQRVVEWGAMMFLLEGARMSRGMQRLRQWLLLALRTLALFGLVLGVARPIAGGWFGGLGGARADEVVVILDRSPSMGALVPGTDRTRLQVALERLTETLRAAAPRRVTVLDGVGRIPTPLAGEGGLVDLATAHVTSATTDVPALVGIAAEHLARSASGPAEIWIASDGEASDWRAGDERWGALAAQLARAPAGVRLRVLSSTAPTREDLAVRVLRAERRTDGPRPHLELDIEVRSLAPWFAPGEATPDGGPESLDVRRVPVTVHLEGVRSQIEVEVSAAGGGVGVAMGQRFELGPEAGSPSTGAAPSGTPTSAPGLSASPREAALAGAVSLAPDQNPANDRAYFVVAGEEVRETVLVAEDPLTREVLRLAAEAPSASGKAYAVRVVELEALRALGAAALEIERAALVLWQAPLPTGEVAEALEGHVRGGGAVVCWPATGADGSPGPAPSTGDSAQPGPDSPRFFGASFGPLVAPQLAAPSGATDGSAEEGAARPAIDAEPGSVTLTSWRRKGDLLRDGADGTPLPLGGLTLREVASIDGDVTGLATLADGTRVLARAPTEAGGAYFVGTLPRPRSSDLAQQGVALIALVQRALELGEASVAARRSTEAGRFEPERHGGAAETWQPLELVGVEPSGPARLSAERFHHAGVLSDGERHVALGRSAGEDLSAPLDPEAIQALLPGVDVHVVRVAGEARGLLQEVWRLFLVLLVVALLAEAALCVGESRREVRG